MHRDSLLRSTPFRLAVSFTVMVVAAFIITGVAVDRLIEWELRQHQDQAIREIYSVIQGAYGDDDLTDMLEIVQANIRATRGLERIFLVKNRQGQVVAGNIGGLGAPLGWSDVDGLAIGLDADLKYRVFAGIVDGNHVFVGISQQEIDSLQDIITSSFAWATLLVTVLAVSGGAGLARRVRRRFDAVSGTMESVSHGNLSARIPLIGRGDDIDLLAGDVNNALARLESTVEGMRQVSADIAHDLKTPLNRLRITVDDALEKEQRGEAVGQDLMEAAAEADRINATFEALLRISQIEAGSRRTRLGTVDLTDILRSLVGIYRDVAEDEERSLTLEAHSATVAEIIGDRDLLTQMFANLIENAIRHCPPGAAINVGIRLSGSEVVARVEDNGPGIPVDEREKVFRRLYRLEKSRTSPGSGLGLSLVKAVADLHDAAIQLLDMKPGLAVEIRFRGTQAISR